MLAWDELLRWFLRVYNLLSSQISGIWIKCPQRFNPCLYLLALLVAGSMNADFSGFNGIAFGDFSRSSSRSTALPKAKGTKGVLFSSRKSSCPTPASSNQPSSRESVWQRKFLIAFQICSLVEPLRFCLSLWTINLEKWALVYFTASHRTLWQRLTVIRNFLVYKTLSPILSFLSPATTLGSEHWLQTVQWLGREA